MRKAKKFDSSSLGSFFAVSELGHKRCTVATRRPEMSFLYLIYIDSGTFLGKKKLSTIVIEFLRRSEFSGNGGTLCTDAIDLVCVPKNFMIISALSKKNAT